MPGRKFNTPTYRYGFNGKEEDYEDDLQDYGMRLYSNRLGRFISIDPVTAHYSFYSPYQFAGNIPIAAIDIDGLEPKSVIDSNGKLTQAAIKVLNELTGVDIALLSQVQISKPRDTKYRLVLAARFNPLTSKGGLTIGQKIYLSKNYFDTEGGYGGDNQFSVFQWLSILSHEVGHLKQADVFGYDRKDINDYLKYFVSGYITRALLLKFPIHDTDPEIVTDLGFEIYDELFKDDSRKKQNKLGYDLANAVLQNDLDKVNQIIDNLKQQINVLTDEYINNHLDEFKNVEHKLNKTQKSPKIFDKIITKEAREKAASTA